MKIFLCLFLFSLNWHSIAQNIPFSIYHTNDLHSHLDGVKKIKNNQLTTSGGFAKISSKILEIKNTHKDEIIFGVDAGDFFSGTIFSAIAPSSEKEFPEYDFLTEHGFELIIFGNHEFDAGNNGLLNMLEKVSKTKNKIPLISTDLEKINQSRFTKFFDDQTIVKSKIKAFNSKHGTLNFLFLGALSPNGCLVSRTTRGEFKFTGFNDTKSKERVDELVDILQKEIDAKKSMVDVVVLSYHGGDKDAEYLALKLKNLHVIIAGHTHNTQTQVINNVYIQQTGSYGVNLGLLNFNFNKKTKTIQNKTMKLFPIDQSVPANPIWVEKISQYRKKAFSLMGHTENPDEVIFKSPKTFIKNRDLFSPMGLLVTSSILKQFNEEVKNEPLDVYFTSMGLIRANFEKDIEYNRADIFEVTSIGFDEALRPGVDLVHFYLSGNEIIKLFNFLEIYSKFTSTFSPIASENFIYKVRSWGIPFLNRLYDLEIDGKKIDKNKLYHVGTNRFVSNNIETVKKLSKGIVDISPKDKNGSEIKIFPTYKKEYILLTERLKKGL